MANAAEQATRGGEYQPKQLLDALREGNPTLDIEHPGIGKILEA